MTDQSEQGGSQLVIGAGVIGGQVARLLAERSDRVTVISRRGSGPAGVTHAAADARDAETMGRLADGAAVIYNCVNPPYHRWPVDWPPIAASVLSAAERSGAVLVTLSNLYGYGPATSSLGVSAYDQSHPITEATPLAATGRKGQVRAGVWRDALAAHQAGRIRAVEVRASDFVGPGAESALGERTLQRVRQGKSVPVLGNADRLHTWSYTGDVARMLIVAGTDARAWGRAWHVPSDAPRTQRQAIEDLAKAAGVGPARIGTIPPAVLAGMGLVWPLMRELRETEYQFRNDFVMDSSAAQATFGLDPTPWEEIVAVTAAAPRVRQLVQLADGWRWWRGWAAAAVASPGGVVAAARRADGSDSISAR
jgi:nucleoside-diphosphate-sugar epimerase